MEIMVLSVRGELAMNFIDIVAALRVWNFSGTAIGVGINHRLRVAFLNCSPGLICLLSSLQ
jgi:hypothetical protein